MKTALVTGVTGGVGLAIAGALLETGEWFVIGMSRTLKRPFSSENYIHMTCDMASPHYIEVMFQELHKGDLDLSFDLVVNNAAAFVQGNFTEMDECDVGEVINTNVKGTINVTRKVIPMMKYNSRVIFINSVSGKHPIKGQALYSASKHALTAFADVIGQELRTSAIRVTSIHPGGINTPLWNESNPYPGDVRVLIDPQEISRLILFILASPHNVEYKSIELFPSVEWH